MTEPEPKSILTWLQADCVDIECYEIDVRIVQFPETVPTQWLYFFALQVNFTDHAEWAHGGFQWAGVSDYQPSGSKGVNWGGGSSWAGYGGNGATLTPFAWQTDCWYRYRVLRLERQGDGLCRWLFLVIDTPSGREFPCGVVVTKSEFIADACVFTETGYGVRCDSPSICVEWRNPCFRTARGTAGPDSLIATYNGSCPDPISTSQELLSATPLAWRHETGAVRAIPNHGILRLRK